MGREIEKAPTENQKKCNTKNSWNQNTVKIALFWLHNQYFKMEMLLKMRCNDSFLVFSTFLDFYNPLYLLKFVETTILTWKFNQKRIISAAPAPLTTAIAKFGQDYDSLLYVFPKLHLFLDLKSLVFHSFEMLTGN